jgi:hypothetical protein
VLALFRICPHLLSCHQSHNWDKPAQRTEELYSKEALRPGWYELVETRRAYVKRNVKVLESEGKQNVEQIRKSLLMWRDTLCHTI